MILVSISIRIVKRTERYTGSACIIFTTFHQTLYNQLLQCCAFTPTMHSLTLAPLPSARYLTIIAST